MRGVRWSDEELREGGRREEREEGREMYSS